MLESLHGTEDPLACRFVAWTCALAQDATADLIVPVALAEKAVFSHFRETKTEIGYEHQIVSF